MANIVAQKALLAVHPDNRTDTSSITFPTAEVKRDTAHTMKAVLFEGNKAVVVKDVGKVCVTDPKDAVVRVTAATVCGSDLHIYHNEFAGALKGDTIGHEAVGIVEDVGPGVTGIKRGDRVAISAVLACGDCEYCKRQQFSLCDCTNGNKEIEKLHGHRCGAVIGYSAPMGGYAGCQAEYARVPLADVNLLPLAPQISDEVGVLLSDILCTAYFGCAEAEVKPGDVVAIWGAGPVGQLTAMWAKFRGASRVILVDDGYRLDVARACIGVETVDRHRQNVVHTIHEMVPGGPNACIEAVGFRFTHSALHRAARAVGAETDSPEVLNEMFTICKKGGIIAVVGEFYAYTNMLNFGSVFIKGLTIRSGMVMLQKYWKRIHGWLQAGLIDPSFIITHIMPLTSAADAYRMFDTRSDDVLKIILRPDARETRKVGPDLSRRAILRMPTPAEWTYAPGE